METLKSLWISVQTTFETAVPGILGYLPALAGAFTVLIVGWLLARLVRAASNRILNALNRILERAFQTGLLASARLPMGASTIIGEIAYWVIIFVTLTLAARVAELPTISSWLDDIVGYLPDILLGFATLAAGYVISSVIGDHFEETAKGARSAQSALLGRVAQAVVFLIAAIIGLGQLGVDVTFIVILAGIAIGAILVGFSIAFGLGSRMFISNLIGARTVRQSLAPGLLVRIGDMEGEILEITQTHIALDTDKGRALVPAHMADIAGVLIVSQSATVAGTRT